MLSKPGEMIRNVTNPDRYAHSTLKNKLLFNPPPGSEGHIDVFKRMVTQDLNKIQIKKAWDPMEIRRGIKQLKEKNNIVIKPVDKGGTMVIKSHKGKKWRNNLKICENIKNF